MSIPLPESLARLVRESRSLSLRFDRGYDGYDANGGVWKHRRASAHEKEGKTEFLQNFVKAFNGSVDEKELYQHTVARRIAALSPLRAQSHTATSSLIVGIGRWNPVEVGFTLDRFTGSPFLPGSTIKGLVHAAAVLVGSGELAGDHVLWANEEALTRVFGKQDQQGAFVFFDALPAQWPVLEVDVMTPHHSKYNDGSGAFAADWDEPVPVHFLRIKAGTRFLFWFGPRLGASIEDGVDAAVGRLLTTALDWLGAGAKTSSGYGWFEAPIEALPPPPVEAIVWEQATLEWIPQTRRIKAVFGSQKAETLDPDILESLALVLPRLKKRKTVVATVQVQRDRNQFIILKITPR
jgi:CRISPR-associated protein Cmr6